MREVCKVKEEGWKEMDTSSTAMSSKNDSSGKTGSPPPSNMDNTLKQTWIVQVLCCLCVTCKMQCLHLWPWLEEVQLVVGTACEGGSALVSHKYLK